MKKILLTGGSGFIGKNIQESYLSEKYQLFAPSSTELNLVDTENVNEYFRTRHFDVVLHAGTKPGHRNARECSDLLHSNVRMYVNLVRHKDCFEKLINFGSGAIYGMQHYQPKMSESFFDKHVPADEHGFCKYMVYRDISQQKNFIDLRIFGIFGKYEDYAIRFISNAICKSLFNLPITIKQNRKFDYIYIDDLMPVLDYFIDSKVCYNAYNITPDASIELAELARMVNQVSGKVLPIVVARDGLGVEYSGDNSRLKQEHKDFRFTPIIASIQKLYSYYEGCRNQLNYEVLLYDR